MRCASLFLAGLTGGTGLLMFWTVSRPIQYGEVYRSGRVELRRRDEEPLAFWFFTSFYAMIAAVLVVLAMGILRHPPR